MSWSAYISKKKSYNEIVGNILYNIDAGKVPGSNQVYSGQ